jgi:hypothetical protein
MANADVVVTIRFSLPWWWRLYVGLLVLRFKLGCRVDIDHAAALIARHSLKVG